jgi:hypothetical protein
MPLMAARPLLTRIAAAGIISFTSIGAYAQPTMPARDRMLPPNTGTATIKGRVVDAQTGVGVARARVRLQAPGNRPPVLTDDTGAFRLAEAPAGMFYLSIDRSGYMATRVTTLERSTISRQTVAAMPTCWRRLPATPCASR